MIDIKGKNAFITGSSRGIGQQIAKGLAQKGCNIIVHGRTEENCAATLELLKGYNVKLYSVSGELSDEESVNGLIKQVQALAINVDILYNNAAVMSAYKEDFWSHSWEDWKTSMTVNVYSLYSISSAFIPAMIENGFGRVINLVSGIKDQPELLPYSTSKWAVLKMTNEIAVKLQDTPIRINTLDPGWLRTDLGGEYAENSVEAVLPGALAPVFIDDDGPNGKSFSALN
ncbi:MAG: 3-oxoacyl-[acyl-carrier protein] reductase [Marivirga sp.]|jgi:3-oxoacyl-[acyl-carrier protein] reductase